MIQLNRCNGQQISEGEKKLYFFKCMGELKTTNSSGESADKNFKMEKHPVLAEYPLLETFFFKKKNNHFFIFHFNYHTKITFTLP